MAARAAAREVYRGYMPVDLPQHRPPKRIKPWWKVEGKPRVTLYPKKQVEGYSEKPEYPPLNDGSRKALKTQVRLDWYQKIKKLPTVEQKMYEICLQGHQRVANLGNSLTGYDPSPMAQYLTQTALVQNLPGQMQQIVENGDHAQEISIEDEDKLNKLRDIILNQLEADMFNSIKTSPPFEAMPSENKSRKTLCSYKSIHNLVLNAKRYLATTNSSLLEYQYDYSPSIKSWWFHSGVPPPDNKRFYWSRKDNDGNINQIIQVNGASALNMRSKEFMKPVVSLDDPLVTNLDLVPKCPYNLKSYGAKFSFRAPTILPGFWYNSDSQHDFPHTCFLPLNRGIDQATDFRLEVLGNDLESFGNSQAILTAFSWLNSLSMHHGYTPLQELDYPFTCQVISTDGRDWLFNIYQMNGHTFHRDLGRATRNNVCWSSGIMRLYENYENGQFTGVNNQVIKNLFDFVMRPTLPDYTTSLNLKPLLGEDARTEEEKELMMKKLRRSFEQRRNFWLLSKWRVPLFEHIFFRSKILRQTIKEMKPEWHPPKPPISKYFD